MATMPAEKLYLARLGQATVNRLKAKGAGLSYTTHTNKGPASRVSLAFDSTCAFERDVDRGESATVTIFRIVDEMAQEGTLPPGFEDCVLSLADRRRIAAGCGAN